MRIRTPATVASLRARNTYTLMNKPQKRKTTVVDYQSNQKQFIVDSLEKLKQDNFSDPEKILAYARFLRGMSFEAVLALELADYLPDSDYSDKNRKGALGNLLEEHYFGYTANSDSSPDFAAAGMELKLSPVEYGNNRKKQRVIKAGERLVLSMIPNNRKIPLEYEGSTLEKKASDILLINYLRDRSVKNTEQVIKFVNRYQISGEDLEIIKADYEKIVRMIQAGRAHELSEGMTNYLGACTKGATAEKSLRAQFYPLIHEDGSLEYKPAKSRAFSLKQSFMTSLVQRFEREELEADRLIQDSHQLHENSFDDIVLQIFLPYEGKYELELAQEKAPDLNPGAKNFYNALTWRLLGSRKERIEEFEKAGISVHAIRVQKNGKIKEKIKLKNFKFADLHAETSWEDSEWYSLLSDKRYLFVVYQEDDNHDYYLRGAFFWAVPAHLIGSEEFENKTGTAYEYWLDTKQKLRNGVEVVYEGGTYKNNFLKASENPVCHIRPSAQQAAYRFTDDRPDVGNVERDADQLPDGQWMTKQAFWLNSELIRVSIEKHI